MCPNNRIGTVDVLLGLHHGQVSSNSPVLVYAIHPRVAIMNNGPRKGGEPEAMQTVHSSPGLEDLWQLHYSVARPASTAANVHETGPQGGPALNTSEQLIANLEEAANHAAVYNIKISAREDGSFVVTNPRNGYSKEYTSHR